MYEVNRSVFLLIPLDPFWNWLQTLPGNHLDGLTLEDIQADANSYLVRPCETADEVWDEIERGLKTFSLPNLPTGAKMRASGLIWTPIFSTNGSTYSSPPSLPTSNTNRSPVKPFNPLI